MKEETSTGVTQITTAAHIAITREAVVTVVVTLAMINKGTKHYLAGVLEFKTFAQAKSHFKVAYTNVGAGVITVGASIRYKKHIGDAGAEALADHISALIGEGERRCAALQK